MDRRNVLVENNFDSIRFLLAFAVFLGHAGGFFIPMMESEWWMFPFIRLGEVAVECFFVISGFLIFMSLERSTNLRSYAKKRAFRVVPAYVAVIFACAFGGALLTDLPLSEYFGFSWVKYLVANLAFMNFIEPSLPGAFESPGTTHVNGSLWTLKIEVMFYVAAPLVFWLLRGRRQGAAILLLYVLSVAYKAGVSEMATATGVGFLDTLSRQLPGQMSYFICGYAVYRYLPEFMLRRNSLAVIAIIGLLADSIVPFQVLRPACLAVLVMYAAFALPFLGRTKTLGDLSYGIYIFHCPILHIVSADSALGATRAAFAVSVAIVVCLAYLSWHYLEKPMLAFSKRGAGPPSQSTETLRAAPA